MLKNPPKKSPKKRGVTPAKTPSKSAVKKHDAIVSASELAQWLGVALPSVARLVAHDRVVRASHGKYLLKESVRKFCDANRKPESEDPSNPKGRRAEALARKAEIETAQMEGNTIELGAAISVFCDHVANARTILLTLPGRVPAAARVATKLAVHEVLEEISQNKKALEAELVAADSRDVGTSA